MADKSNSGNSDPKKEGALSWLDYVRKTDKELLKICRVDTFRGSGKGGQKRNKTSNAVRLTLHKIAVTGSSSRSKAQNITSALRKLRLAIALENSSDFPRGTHTEAFPEEIQPYISRNTIRIRSQNPVFPIFVGCLLDHFFKLESDWKLVAAQFGVSNSQLRRFVDKHPGLRLALEGIQKDLTENKIETQKLNSRRAP